MKRIVLAAFAALTVAAIAYAAPDVDPWRSVYEQRQHKVPQRFDKEIQVAYLDAGTGSKIAGRLIAAAQPQDGGILTSICQFGHKALTNGDAGVTFRSAFSSIPSCTCSHVPTTNATACSITTASTTAVGFSIQSADTDVVHFTCCGDL